MSRTRLGVGSLTIDIAAMLVDILTQLAPLFRLEIPARRTAMLTAPFTCTPLWVGTRLLSLARHRLWRKTMLPPGRHGMGRHGMGC